MLKKSVFFFLIISTAILSNSARDYNELSTQLSQEIAGFFSSVHKPVTSVVHLSNNSFLSDTAVQKLYQLIVFNLEKNKTMTFHDTMLSFVNGKGKFSGLSKKKLNYLISLKIIQNRHALGIGASIFSVNLNRIVFIKYLEKPLDKAETNYLNIREHNFDSYGFSKRIEINVKKNLMDVTHIAFSNALHYFFYYDRKIDILNKSEHTLKKIGEIPVFSNDDYFPTMEAEGRLYTFSKQNSQYLIAGSNTASNSAVFQKIDSTWHKKGSLDFVPLGRLNSGGELLVVGARYELGKNYFQKDLIFKKSDQIFEAEGPKYYKSVDPFYDIAFHVVDDILSGLFIVNRAYRLTRYSPNFEMLLTGSKSSGASLCTIGGKWLVRSAFLKKSDKMVIHKLDGDLNTPIYVKEIDGEILRIMDGFWDDKTGMWLYIRAKSGDVFKYTLQFWSKNET